MQEKRKDIFVEETRTVRQSRNQKLFYQDTDEHNAPEPQPKKITPSLPSPLEGEG